MIETVFDAPDRPSPAAARRATRTAADLDFARSPFTVIWEITRACALRCVHCRADAQPWRHPLELSTAEGLDLMAQIRDLGTAVLVLTGGDPLQRTDLLQLIDRAVHYGLTVAVTPSGTPSLTGDAVRRLQAHGVARMALSLDGPTEDVHDGFRQQPGSYRWTLDGVAHAREIGLPVQINTTVTRHNLAALPAIAHVVEDIGAAMWSVFFLVTVGRARAADQLDAAEFEQVFEFLYELSLRAPFAVRSTAAPHYRRYVLQRHAAAKRAGVAGAAPQVAGMTSGGPRASRGVTDGRGLVFISHTGDVYPSGFLPITAGNVRRQPLTSIYRESPLFIQLRDADGLGGKCGICEFRNVCGGSRARAYATSGDPFAEEPLCAYEPRSH